MRRGGRGRGKKKKKKKKRKKVSGKVRICYLKSVR